MMDRLIVAGLMSSDATNECCYRGTTKIFIGNIKIGTTSAELREAFDKHGKVTEADVVGGFGFVVSQHACWSVFKHPTLFLWL